MMISEQQTAKLKDERISREHRARFDVKRRDSQRFVVWSPVSPQEPTADENSRRYLKVVGDVAVQTVQVTLPISYSRRA